MRLEVGADGAVSEVSLLRALGAPDAPADVIDRLISVLRETRFAAGPGTATFAVPIDDLRCAEPMFTKLDLDVGDLASSVVVTGPGGAAHQLNSTAALILECCTGETGPREIAKRVQATFELSSPPRDDVEGCLLELLGAGLIIDARAE